MEQQLGRRVSQWQSTRDGAGHPGAFLTRAHRRIECDGRWVVQAVTKPAGLAQARGYVAYLRRSPGGPRVINPRGGDITQAPGG